MFNSTGWYWFNSTVFKSKTQCYFYGNTYFHFYNYETQFLGSAQANQGRHFLLYLYFSVFYQWKSSLGGHCHPWLACADFIKTSFPRRRFLFNDPYIIYILVLYIYQLRIELTRYDVIVIQCLTSAHGCKTLTLNPWPNWKLEWSIFASIGYLGAVMVFIHCGNTVL